MFDFTSLQVHFRDEFKPFAEANISIANTAFLYGLGVFTGIRAHWNEEEQQLYIFRPQDHYNRFVKSCRLCNFDNFEKKYTYEKFLGVLVELLKRNEIKQDAYIRVTEFTDAMEIGPKFARGTDSMAIFLYPLGNYVPTTGMRCMVSSWRRVDDNAIPARAKLVGSYVNTAFAKEEALKNGYDEAIVLDSIGHAVEGSAENLFIVREGKIITPPVTDNILEGITRKTVITIAHDLGYAVVERSIDRTELYLADEVFLSGTGAKVSPVSEIDGYTIGVGEISAKIQNVYFDCVKGKKDTYKAWVTGVY
jgi:branched-chain amino acid aminotransferase